MVFHNGQNIKGKNAERPKVRAFLQHQLITNVW